ncbi:hypothetical protein [Fusobacterium sp. FSA-380-WT-3A]|uniref:hypothetical protein n=1 Tax=Fusobacterium sp. FSA-380-WT-3A TaxID=2725304 RepID=UPI001476C72C|nr:hypothetical protein [Fusobacterium sp. FSA-380-WT-3A]NME36476.1 hypothetical protein [Fusobacterium sp. FSA-380-WT-3A]
MNTLFIFTLLVAIIIIGIIMKKRKESYDELQKDNVILTDDLVEKNGIFFCLIKKLHFLEKLKLVIGIIN